MIVKHPTLNAQYDVPDADVDRWKASGWLPLLNDQQRARLAKIEAEVEHRCPTCDASGDEPCRTQAGNPASRHKARG